ncbi:clasp N terminal-domain-containing protein [Spinellus fusiger]|nr:clasp N terminal-domain-containing protein [Spinellus fusiger]
MANTDSVVPAISITSLKDLEKDLSGLLKVLDSRKETEADWELREKALLHLGGIIKSDSVSCYKKRLVQGLHDLAEGIVVVLHSLRTSLSLKAISLITDIGVYLGSFLDAYTFDTFFSNLLRCSSQNNPTTMDNVGRQKQPTTTLCLHLSQDNLGDARAKGEFKGSHGENSQS